MDSSMVVLNGVSKVYSNGQKALDNINLDIRKGEFLFLSGSSGAGKTSLLELLLKEEEPTRGMIQVNGIDLGKLKERQVYRYRRMIGMVFQDFRLFPILPYMRMSLLPRGCWRYAPMRLKAVCAAFWPRWGWKARRGIIRASFPAGKTAGGFGEGHSEQTCPSSGG